MARLIVLLPYLAECCLSDTKEMQLPFDEKQDSVAPLQYLLRK